MTYYLEQGRIEEISNARGHQLLVSHAVALHIGKDINSDNGAISMMTLSLRSYGIDFSVTVQLILSSRIISKLTSFQGEKKKETS